MNKTFMAGFAKVDICPLTLGYPMDGYGNGAVRRSTGYASPIYATAVAVTDPDGNSAVMVSVDSCAIDKETCDSARQWAEVELGIPQERVIIAATHHHSAPVSYSDPYNSELRAELKTAIAQAMEDRAPARMYINKIQVEAMNFCRRAWYKDGGFVTPHSGNRASGFDHYETIADPEMRLVKFVREGAKDILMVNFQVHPQMGTNSKSTIIHADYIGVMRDIITEKLGVNCVYFTGSSGNLTPGSYAKEHMVTDDYVVQGGRAADYVIAAEGGYTEAKTGPVRGKEIDKAYATDHSMDHLLAAATAVQKVRDEVGIAAAHEERKKYPELNSAFQATAVVNKAQQGPTRNCNLTVITFGDVAFSAHPYEMFDTNGKQVRDGTVGDPDFAPEDQLSNPFPMTFVTAPANGINSYIPSKLAFDNGGYARDLTRYARGSGERMAADVLHMLNELHNQ